LEDVPVALKTLDLIDDYRLSTVGAFLTVLINFLRQALKMLTVEVHESLCDRFVLVKGVVHRDELLIIRYGF
jgi:hypothetical protein